MERDRDDSAKRSRSITLRTISQEQQGKPASGSVQASAAGPNTDAPDAPDAPPPARSDADHWTPFDREAVPELSRMFPTRRADPAETEPTLGQMEFKACASGHGPRHSYCPAD